jgi:hypothetical protein
MSDCVPALRRVEAFPIDHDGARFVGLRDPAGYTATVLMLPGPLLDIVSLFDGEHSIADIQAALMRHRGELVPRARIEELAGALDEHGFLDSPRFAERRGTIEAEFRAAPSRPASHAGGAYAGDGPGLRAMLDGCFTAPDGPGAVEWTSASGSSVRGLIAPHIDLHRGGVGYAWAYRELAAGSDADLFVIFGTCHAGMADPFALTAKDFETPLGAAPVDRDFVARLAAGAGQDCFGSELAHRTEHSIEFQAVLLRYLFGERRDVSIVPILTSFAHEALARGDHPEDDPRVPRFFDALAATVAGSGRRVAFIAGADLAHVGPRFGDPEAISPEALASVAGEDRAMLDSVEAGSAAAFFESVRADGDRRRICGLSPIYALLRALPGARGALRHYGQWPDPQAVVTYASVVF